MIRTTEVEAYLSGLRPPADDLLREMRAFAREPRIPIADPETSALVAVLARAIGATSVLEVGLAIGYTALQVARVLPPDGVVVALEVNDDMIVAARGYLQRDPAGSKVCIVHGDARQTMAAEHGPFDLVFIDADKRSYAQYVDLALERLRPDGLMLIDNLLMDGAAATGVGNDHWSQASVDAGRELSRRLSVDPRLDFVLLPVGDGVGLVQRSRTPHEAPT
jgi:predicted O-methyltransferase YrrM